MADNPAKKIWQTVKEVLFRPNHMVTDWPLRSIWCLSVIGLAILIGFMFIALQKSVTGSITRDWLLVMMGSGLAGLFGLFGWGLAWELRTREAFWKMTRATITEDFENLIRLENKRSYSCDFKINDKSHSITIPLYMMGTSATREAACSDLVRLQETGRLLKTLLLAEEFNRLTSVAENWVAALLAQGQPSPALADGLTKVCSEIESIQNQLTKRLENKNSD